MSRRSLLGEHGYSYSMLSDREKELYEKLYGMVESRLPIDASQMAEHSIEDMKRALACIDMDHPELFWMNDYRSPLASVAKVVSGGKAPASQAISGFLHAQDTDGDGLVSLSERIDGFTQPALKTDPLMKWDFDGRLELSPLLTDRRIAHLQAIVNEATEPFCQQMRDNPSDFDVLRQALVFLARNTDQSTRSSGGSRDVRSVFLEGESTSAGYSEALQYLLLQCGIPCFAVRGLAVHPTTERRVPHSWNYVLIDGGWNIVDPMWGDWNSGVAALPHSNERFLEESPFNYSYMSLTGADRSCAEIVPLPEPAHSSDYFVREKRDLSELTLDSAADALFSLFSAPSTPLIIRCRRLDSEAIDFLRRVVPACLLLFAITDGDIGKYRESRAEYLKLARAAGRASVLEKGLGNLLDIHVVSLGNDLYGLHVDDHRESAAG